MLAALSVTISITTTAHKYSGGTFTCTVSQLFHKTHYLAETSTGHATKITKPRLFMALMCQEVGNRNHTQSILFPKSAAKLLNSWIALLKLVFYTKTWDGMGHLDGGAI